MTPEEFAERKAQLEAERRRGIELIEAVYREQLRGLEILQRSGGGQAAATAAESVAPPAVSAPSVAAPAPAAAAPPPVVVRRSSAQLWRDIQAALPRMPEVFTTPQLTAAIGYSPHRGTLHRHLAELESQGLVRTEYRGDGRQLSRLRRLSPGRAAEGAGDGGEMAPAADAGEEVPPSEAG